MCAVCGFKLLLSTVLLNLRPVNLVDPSGHAQNPNHPLSSALRWFTQLCILLGPSHHTYTHTLTILTTTGPSYNSDWDCNCYCTKCESCKT